MLKRWNDDKMDALDAKVEGLDSKVGVLDSKVNDMDVRLARVEVRVDEGFQKIDERFEQVDKRFEKVDAELLEQRREMKAGFDKIDERFQRFDERFQRIRRALREIRRALRENERAVDASAGSRNGRRRHDYRGNNRYVACVADVDGQRFGAQGTEGSPFSVPLAGVQLSSGQRRAWLQYRHIPWRSTLRYAWVRRSGGRSEPCRGERRSLDGNHVGLRSSRP